MARPGMLLRDKLSTCAIAITTILLSATSIHAAPKPIRVAIYSDAGATKAGVTRLKECLPESKGFETKSITAEQIREGELKNFDVLIHPGGTASKQGATLGEKG